MARRYRPGDIKWIAYPEGIARVEILSRGLGGRVFREGRKPENPYVVMEEDGDEYVLGEDLIHDDPVSASIRSAELRVQLGLQELRENPEEGDEEDEDEDEDDLEENEGDDKDFEDEDEDDED